MFPLSFPLRFRTLLPGALFLLASTASGHPRDDSEALPPYDADGHAPIGVMGDHLHDQGEFMLSWRYQAMAMSGLRDGTGSLDDRAVLQLANPFAGNPGQPPKMRILPRDMRMDMHMVGAMYGVTDRITLMGMGMFMGQSMTLETRNMPGKPIGTFDTSASGFSGGSVTALIGLSDGEIRSHLLLGAGLPGGSLDSTGEALLPNGMRRDVRLPYAMQAGNGTFDARPGIVVQTKRGNASFGGQVRGKFRLGENSEGYRSGNEFLGTAWLIIQPTPAAAFTVRVQADTTGAIEGRDSLIAGPVPTADPANYGGTRVTGHIGLNLAGQSGVLREHRLAIELGIPLREDLNGPQMERTWTLTVGCVPGRS